MDRVVRVGRAYIVDRMDRAERIGRADRAGIKDGADRAEEQMMHTE